MDRRVRTITLLWLFGVLALNASKGRSQLEKFLFAPKNSHAKESLINNKLLFDLKLAAAERGYFLNVYLPEVDKDGFDMIFDDHDLVVKTQLKTVMRGAGTSSWKIHKRILRPTVDLVENFGFECSPSGHVMGKTPMGTVSHAEKALLLANL